jgi:chromosome segregation ATPase
MSEETLSLNDALATMRQIGRQMKAFERLDATLNLLAGSTAAIKDMERKREAAAKEVEELKADFSRLRAMREEYEKSFSAYQADVAERQSTLRTEIDQLRSQKASLEEELKSLEARKVKFEAALKDNLQKILGG